MGNEEFFLTQEEAAAVTSCVRIVKGLIEGGHLDLKNAEIFHKLTTSSLYKLTEGDEGELNEFSSQHNQIITPQ